MQIEYRVIPVTRFIVTRYEDTGDTGSVREMGEYGNYATAYAVGYALAKKEHDDLGWPLGDERLLYPRTDPEAERPLTQAASL